MERQVGGHGWSHLCVQMYIHVHVHMHCTCSTYVGRNVQMHSVHMYWGT